MLCGEYVNRVAAHSESAAAEIHVIALVLHAHQLRNGVALAQLVARAQGHDHFVIRLGLANTVDGRHRGHDDHVASLQNALGARQAHLLNMLVNCAVFFDEQIALRHIGFRLVIVVIADEIFHRIVRKKLTKLAVQLRRQCLVVCKHNRRAAQPGNHIGHGEGLARAGDAQEGLKHFAVIHTFDQLVNRLRLVTRRGIRLVQFKGRIRVADKNAGRC